MPTTISSANQKEVATSAEAGGYRDLKKGADPKEWEAMPADFSKLDNGSDSLVIDGQAVMESWEKPFMEALAECATRNRGTVLEVGFGLHLSADGIQKHGLDKHIIIEANKDVFKELEAWAAQQKHQVEPMLGLAMDAIKKVPDNSLDGVLYDPYPQNEEEQHIHQFPFMKEVYRCLKPGGIMTYCNLTSLGLLKEEHKEWDVLWEKTQKQHILDCGFDEKHITFEIFKMPYPPPEECRYYHHDTCLVPVLYKQPGKPSVTAEKPSVTTEPAATPVKGIADLFFFCGDRPVMSHCESGGN